MSTFSFHNKEKGEKKKGKLLTPSNKKKQKKKTVLVFYFLNLEAIRENNVVLGNSK